MTDIIRSMSTEEAMQCIQDIRGHLRSARRLAIRLFEQRGWLVLGYASYADCLKEELDYSTSYAYRLLGAASVERNLMEYEQSPIGENYNVESLPEASLRPLTPLSPDEQRAVWEVVKQTSPTETITADHIKSVVGVAKSMLVSGAIDDGTGNDMRISDIPKAAIIEETYERMQRQKQHIADNLARKEGRMNFVPLTDSQGVPFVDRQVKIAAYQVNSFITFKAPDLDVQPEDILYVTIKRKGD